MRNQKLFAAGLAVLVVGASTAGCAKREVYVGTSPGAATPSGGQAAGGPAVSNQSLLSELQRLSTAQRAFFDQNEYFAADTQSLGFTPASGVRVDVIQGDTNGFSAIARSGEAECAVYSGDVRSPRSYLSAPDVAACRS